MNAYLSISHLIRHFLLFVVTVILLLSISRAGYCLWQLTKFADTQTLVQTFVQGIRFDFAAIGIILFVPLFVVPLFAMFRWSLGLARFLSITWLVLALIFVLILELITPYFIQQSGVRPDLHVLSSMENPLGVVTQIRSEYLIPALIGIVLVLLIIIAFWRRLETSRFLRYPIRKIPAILLSLFGAAICVFAVKSSFDLKKPALDVSAALVSTESVVNEIALSSPFKILSPVSSNSPRMQSFLNFTP